MFLLFKNDDSVVTNISTFENLVILIGRSKDQANISFDNNAVSSLHAKVKFIESKLYIEDLESKNGTYINGKLIESRTPLHLLANDIVRFGNFGFSELHVLEENTTGNSKKEKIIFGRSEECDVTIEDKTISRKHASLTQISDSSFLLRDLNSTNGTYFNGQKISETIIDKNDFFIIGKHFVFTDKRIESLENKLAIKVHDLTKMFNQKNVALHPISFEIKPKTFTAIMGPSGCGKSTLLKSLINQISISTGEIKLFGLNLKSDFQYLKKQIGYVPQDDIIHLELTVYQSISFAAKLRLDHCSKVEIEDRVNYLLKVLHLENIKNNFNHAISGGQRKRVCIAIELLSNPLILFLDEPTSPLDPQSIEEFLTILNKLKHEGTTIVMVTHKPEDLAFVDEVIFLAEKGHLVFHGKNNKYLEFFGVKTTTEVYAELSGKKAYKWIKEQKISSSEEHYLIQENNFKREKINWVKQCLNLTKRNLRIKLNDKINSVILLIQAPIIAFLISIIFDEITIGVLFMMCISSIWFGVNNASREIVKEKNIYERERNFNLKISTYLSSKILTLILLATVQSVLFSSVLTIRYSNSFVPFYSFFQLFLFLVFITAVSSILGLLVSATMKNTEKVMALVPILLIPQIMLTGVIAKINNVFVEVLSYFTISRWGLDGLAKIQEQVSLIKPKLSFDSNKIPLKDELGNIVLENQKIKQNSIELLNENYHSSFKSIFKESSFNLDMSVLLTVSLLMLFTLFIVIKRKDLKDR